MPTPATAIPVREIALVAVLAVAIYVLLSIGSYSPFDPAWTVAGSDLAVSNQFGRWGAYTADIMLLVFGWPAYLLPASLTGVAVLLLRPSWRDSLSWLTTLIRVSGFALMLAATCLLADLHFTGGDFPAGPGGALGKSLVDVGLPVLNWIGLTLVAIAVLAMGTQATIGYSWPMIAEYTGRGVHLAMRSLAAGSMVAGRAVHQGVTRLLNADPPSTRREEPSARARTASTRSRKEPAVGRRQVAERRKPQVEEPVVSGSTGIQRRLFDLKGEGELPDLELLEDFAGAASGGYSKDSLEAMSRLLEIKLADFKVDAEVVSVLPGPVVTRFELQPAPGVKVSKISSLAKDLARSLAVVSVRIVEVIPGKSVVSIEIPNEQREVVRLKEILNSRNYRDS